MFPSNPEGKAVCLGCGKREGVSRVLSLCSSCIKEQYHRFLPHINEVHKKAREPFLLPSAPPKENDGVSCGLCVNDCLIAEGKKGYCGVRENKSGRIIPITGTSDSGLLNYYHDPLPTNCVASFVCPAGSSYNKPDYSYAEREEYGFFNLAVFYLACSFNCLFCQNWQFKNSKRDRIVTTDELAALVDEKTACICYFGGDPTPQIIHSIKAAKIALSQVKGRILRICWETNGSMAEKFAREIGKIALDSGGCIKFDLKALDDRLHRALTGSSNRRTIENFRLLAKIAEKRTEPPLLIASTLLIPGYITPKEVEKIACFIASINPDIPYSLLAFYPQFLMDDLPTTSRKEAYLCYEAACSSRLNRVNLGNVHLLR
jgi:pyruvate formate lyase activating enzyme